MKRDPEIHDTRSAMQPDPARDRRTLVILAVVLFVACTVVRSVLASYPKALGVRPDELRYLDIASSLVNNGMLVERGGLSCFQKILYPLAIAPAMLLHGAQLRLQVIAVLNSVYACSAVFPALVIARRLFDRKAPVVFCMLATMIAPDMCYSMTFMSECVYLPLCLWLVACMCSALSASGGRQLLWSLASGVLCYAVYLAKEVALGFALALLCILVARFFTRKGERLRHLGCILVFALGFALPFAALKLTLFSGLLNSYNQANIDVLADPYVGMFGLYALATDLAHFVMAFMFFPLLLPAIAWDRLKRHERELYLVCLLTVAFIFASVVYTISIREDLGHMAVRQHLRYVGPLFLPLLFLFARQVTRGDACVVRRGMRRRTCAWCAVTGMCVLCAFTFASADFYQGFDGAQYQGLRWVLQQVQPLTADFGKTVLDRSTSTTNTYGHAWLEIAPAEWAAKLAAIVFLVGGMAGLLTRKRKGVGVVLVAAMVAVMAANNPAALLYNIGTYQITEEAASEASAVDAFIASRPESEQVLIVVDEKTSPSNNLIDAYIVNRHLNCHYIKKEDFDKQLAGTSAGSQAELLAASDATAGDNIYGADGHANKDAQTVTWLVAADKYRINLDESCAAKIEVNGVAEFTVHRIKDGANLKRATLGASADL